MPQPAAAPLVSVIIPTHQRLALLQVALASVLAQRDVALEVIVVDEASSDGTADFLTRQAESDPRVRMVHHDEPRKLPGARNAGLTVARGEWVAFLDDDDVWHPGKLAAQLAAAAERDAQWVCTGVAHTNDQLNAFHLERPIAGIVEALWNRNAIPGGGSAVLARRALLQAVGGFDESLRAAEDWECWIRLAQRAGEPAIAPEVLVGYRTGSSSMSHDAARMLDGFAAVADKHPKVQFAHGAAAADLANYLGLQLARGGHRRAAASLLLGVRPRRGPLLLRAGWVLATGQPWVRPTWTRPAATRAELADATSWLHDCERDAAARFTNAPAAA